MKEKMKVSVAVCTYNGEAYIEEQINSILNQSVKVDEIIIGDDGSVDNTLFIIEKLLKDSKIRYKVIRNKMNLGYRKNFENAILNTTGQIVFLCDQDDIWMENKVEVMLAHFTDNPQCLLCFSNAYLVNEELEKLPLSLWDGVHYNKNRNKFLSWWELFLSGYYVTGATMAIRKELFDKAYPFSNIWQHDGWLAMYAAIYNGIEEEPMKLIKYRQHGNNQIGADACYTIKGKINKKKEILEKGKSAQKERYSLCSKRYSELMDRCAKEMGSKQKKQLKKAWAFNEKMIDKFTQKRINAIKIIFDSWRRGDYNRYCKKGFGTMLADLIFLFV